MCTFLLIFGLSCKKMHECEEPLDVRQSFLLLSFKKSSGEYLHSEVNPLFSKDSLKIKDENGVFYSVTSQLNTIPNTFSRYWEFEIGSIYNPNTDLASFDNTLCKNFIINYNNNFTDTIKICFKSLKNNCGSVFSNLKIYNKNQIISETSNTISAKCLITKN